MILNNKKTSYLDMFKLSLFLSYPCVFTLVLFADVIGEFYIKIKEKNPNVILNV